MITQVFWEGTVSEAVATLVEQTKTGVVQVSSGRRGQGAGVIWGSDGLILTNHHVVANSQGALKVALSDGRELAATLLGSEGRYDLALLRVAALGLPALPVGDSSRLRVGELVFAIGHPWGQKDVVTAGIVSGLDTATVGEQERLPYIRTDVRLRPGNSGGPLLNAQGEVVGINAMVFGGDLSIAIPSQVATAWAAGVLAPIGQRATLGVHIQAVALPGRANPQGGLLVVGLVAGGAAERAGLLVGDIIVAANGVAVAQPAQMARVIERVGVGATLRLQLIRGGAERALDMTI
jgi:serine protease Do